VRKAFFLRGGRRMKTLTDFIGFRRYGFSEGISSYARYTEIVEVIVRLLICSSREQDSRKTRLLLASHRKRRIVYVSEPFTGSMHTKPACTHPDNEYQSVTRPYPHQLLRNQNVYDDIESNTRITGYICKPDVRSGVRSE
jgi:hypothetical protein